LHVGPFIIARRYIYWLMVATRPTPVQQNAFDLLGIAV
jgi:hypothetical protein